jgi:hypothetical protein
MFRERPREGRPFREAKRVRFPFSSTNFPSNQAPQSAKAPLKEGLFPFLLPFLVRCDMQKSERVTLNEVKGLAPY